MSDDEYTDTNRTQISTKKLGQVKNCNNDFHQIWLDIINILINIYIFKRPLCFFLLYQKNFNTA